MGLINTSPKNLGLTISQTQDNMSLKNMLDLKSLDFTVNQVQDSKSIYYLTRKQESCL
jgi:hypothetical protein